MVISREDFEFLKKQNWTRETGSFEKGDYQISYNKFVWEKLSKQYNELTEEDAEFLQGWVTKLKEKKGFFSSQPQVLQLIATRQEDDASELLAEIIERSEYFYSIKQDKTSEVWYYEEGIYKPNGESHIKEICRQVFGKAYTPQRANKVIAKVQADTYIEADDFFKRELENIDEIPVLNGVLNVRTRELTPFTPKKIFFNKVNAEYNPKAECPATEKFLSEVLKNPEDINVSFEISGTTLYKKYFPQVATMLIGSGENGKGVYENHLKKFLGEKNCSSVPLNQLTPDSFSVAGLFGKLANLAGDISNTDLKDTGRFKELTSGTDLVSAKRKFLTDLFFENYAKLIFSCNELPRTYDFSHGFWRRWLILEFPYKFLKEKEYNLATDKTNIKKADQEIINKISTPEEMSGFLNESLNGLDRIFKTKQFSYTKSTAEVKDFWIRKSDSFTAFCLDMIEEDVENYISKQNLRREFNKYCKKHKVRGAGDKNIKAVLEDMFGVVEVRKTTGEGFERENVWEGIRFKRKNELKTSDVKDVNGFSTLGHIGDLHIGSKTPDSLDVNKKNEFSDQKDTQVLKQALEILQDETGRLIPKESILNIALGFDTVKVIEKAKREGLIHEPKDGFIQLL